ncbi:MAG TPA: ferredoxin [bacterium]|nr:ferredoxin [bacterium]
MKNEKIILPVMFSLVLVSMLAGCADTSKGMKNQTVSDATDSVQTINANAVQTDSTLSNSNNDEQVTTDSGDNVVVKVLAISGNKCLGCGKCARTAASNFAMNGGKAVVVSQENIDSSSVSRAINNCPGKAISIS